MPHPSSSENVILSEARLRKAKPPQSKDPYRNLESIDAPIPAQVRGPRVWSNGTCEVDHGRFKQSPGIIVPLSATGGLLPCTPISAICSVLASVLCAASLGCCQRFCKVKRIDWKDFPIYPSPTAHRIRMTELEGNALIFEENRGQVSTDYQFVSHQGGLTALFSKSGADLILPDANRRGAAIGLRLLGTRSDSGLTARGRLAGESNYFIGNDPKGWIHSVPQNSEIVYEGIYQGIDLVFHGQGAQLEHDFRVAAGAKPDEICFALEGSRSIALDVSGNLRISAGSGVLIVHKPYAYQETANGPKAVKVEFEVTRQHEIRFRMGAYNRNRELIIDPVFSFSTYLVGNSAGSTVTAATTDAAGNVYVTGYTTSGFPIVNGVQPTLNGTNNAFISKFDPTGHTLLYSTYLGGAGVFGNAGNFASAIALDPSGNIIVAGTSMANDFPHAGSVPPVNCQINNSCPFIASLTPDGSSLNYSGLIGGGGGTPRDYGNEGRMAVDSQGDVYLAGVTDDPNFQITPGTLANKVPGYPFDAGFVLKVDTTGALVYATILPGTLPADPTSVTTNVFTPSGVTVDANGQATIAGTAGPGLPTTPGVVQTSFPTT